MCILCREERCRTAVSLTLSATCFSARRCQMCCEIPERCSSAACELLLTFKISPKKTQIHGNAKFKCKSSSYACGKECARTAGDCPPPLPPRSMLWLSATGHCARKFQTCAWPQDAFNIELGGAGGDRRLQVTGRGGWCIICYAVCLEGK